MKELITTTKQLSEDASALLFSSPVEYVYNPLEYAWAAHHQYISRYARKGAVLLVGMNPGPFGMAQTGVPFGDVAQVRDLLGIEEAIGAPAKVHPKRPVEGFGCSRSEVSGTRLWGWVKERFATVDDFFDRFYVVNYCPLVFMSATGANITPNKLSADEQRPLLAICNKALVATVKVFAAPQVIGIGGFAETMCQDVLGDMDIRVGRVLHPSPASPIANRGWAPQAEAQLMALGVL